MRFAVYSALSFLAFTTHDCAATKIGGGSNESSSHGDDDEDGYVFAQL